MNTDPPQLGSTVICAETGKPFVIARDGCSFNYATYQNGDIVSDEGVDIRLRRELLNRSKPIVLYVSGNAKHVTGWKGNILGTIVKSYSVRNSLASGGYLLAVTVRDVHGGMWHGRGAGENMCITLRPSKRKSA